MFFLDLCGARSLRLSAVGSFYIYAHPVRKGIPSFGSVPDPRPELLLHVHIPENYIRVSACIRAA